VDSLDLTLEPHPRFLVQGHILSVGGDALMALYAKGSGFLNPSLFLNGRHNFFKKEPGGSRF
jgi:hypothetical protein